MSVVYIYLKFIQRIPSLLSFLHLMIIIEGHDLPFIHLALALVKNALILFEL